MSHRTLLFLTLLLLLSTKLTPSLSTPQPDTEYDDNLAFLESEEGDDAASSLPDPHRFDQEIGDDDDDESFSEFDDADHSHYDDNGPEIDDRDVVVLTKGNFSDFVGDNKFVMVEFYAPWCGHCQMLAPEYAAAATELKGDVALVKVDATVESELAQEYGVEGFPTVVFFDHGVQKPYTGQRTK